MEQIKQLILKQLRGALTVVEQAELEEWLNRSPENSALYEEISDPGYIAASLSKMDRLHEQQVWERLTAYSAGQKEEIPNLASGEPFAIRPLHSRRNWWAAAAAIILVLGTGGWLLLFQKPSGKALSRQEMRTKDLPPGRNGAVLTLAGGQQIFLDSSAGKGVISRQGNTTLVNANGQLAYNPTKGKVVEPMYNTLTTQRGNQYQLVLPDGSHVWLNAASSITYPTVFNENKREVKVSGEAYFEIASMPRAPFKVIVNNMEIAVLGTHFNVNAYPDEDHIETTLLEGKVQLNNGGQSVLLVPGQQAKFSPGRQGLFDIDKHVDVEKIVAWRNGMFEFDEMELPGIMRQISRWYDVDIAYETRPGNKVFGGAISKRVPLSDVLRMLEVNGIQFRLEGSKLIVKP